ncbi:MAG: TIR domain-containing protein [Planctomycetes bacterium]|nr:TIR domain-containing protein [Planctomycetota bacterium]
MPEEHPKLFISYSWSTQEHEEWVLRLASGLRESGVDVVLDKWDLREGQDKYKFMERMVNDPEVRKVAIVSDASYVEKANLREGGVGTETEIISPEVYAKAEQTKFVVIVRERDQAGKPLVPTFCSSRIFIDLSDDDRYGEGFEQLLRWVYDKPLHVKPELGVRPAFLSDEERVSLSTTPAFTRAVDAIRNSRPHKKGALSEFFGTFVTNLERFRIAGREGEFDDHVVDSIDRFLPFRNQAIEVFAAVAQYADTEETREQVHRFFEGLVPYLDRPKNVTSWSDWDFDNFRFVVHEMFLYAVAVFLKRDCFLAASHLMQQRYYVEERASSTGGPMRSFVVFREHMQSLERRNHRLGLRRLCVRADMLKQRAASSGLEFRSLMLADFTLFLRECFEVLNTGGQQRWWPYTLLYAESELQDVPFEVFARAESTAYFDRIKCILGIQQKSELGALAQAFHERKLHIPSWEFTGFNPLVLMGYSRLATRP